MRRVEPGDVLFREGDDSYDFFVVESGAVAIVRGYGSENRVIAVHGAHRFLGELNLLTGGRRLPDRGRARPRRGDPRPGRQRCAALMAPRRARAT